MLEIRFAEESAPIKTMKQQILILHNKYVNWPTEDIQTFEQLDKYVENCNEQGEMRIVCITESGYF